MEIKELRDEINFMIKNKLTLSVLNEIIAVLSNPSKGLDYLMKPEQKIDRGFKNLWFEYNYFLLFFEDAAARDLYFVGIIDQMIELMETHGSPQDYENLAILFRLKEKIIENQSKIRDLN